MNLEENISNWRQQMLAAGIKSPVPLEELESHLRDEIERQMDCSLTAHARNSFNSAAALPPGEKQACRNPFAA